MPEETETTFLSRSASLMQQHKGKALVTGGTGLSAAAVIFFYSMFATKTEMLHLQQSLDNEISARVELETELDAARQMIARLDERTKKP